MRNICTLVAGLLLAGHLSAQTRVVGGATGNGDFEAGATGWNLVNGTQANKWVIGPNTLAGSNALFISSSAAAPYAHSYNPSAASLVFAYRDVPVPAGATMMWMRFDVTNVGEGAPDPYSAFSVIDGLRIYSKPVSTPVVAGQYQNGFVPHGIAALPGWDRRRVYPVDVTPYAGGSVRIIFEWENNGSGGSQHPAAIDNVEFWTSCQNGTGTYPSQNNIGTATAQIGWNSIGGATGYQLRFRKFSEDETADTWSGPMTIAGGSSYYTTLTSLAPGTDYEVQVRPVGIACAEYGWPGTFRTQVATAVAEVQVEAGSVRFYPNPVRDVLTVNLNTTRGRALPFRLVDGDGRTVKTATLKPGSNTLNVSGLPAGVYHGLVQDGQKSRPVRLLKVN